MTKIELSAVDRKTAVSRFHVVLDALELGMDVSLSGYKLRRYENSYCVVAASDDGDEHLLRPGLGAGFPVELLIRWSFEMPAEDFAALAGDVALNKIKRTTSENEND